MNTRKMNSVNTKHKQTIMWLRSERILLLSNDSAIKQLYLFKTYFVEWKDQQML